MNLSCVRGVWGILCGIWTTLWEKKLKSLYGNRRNFKFTRNLAE